MASDQWHEHAGGKPASQPTATARGRSRERRCVLTGDTAPADRLIRLVVDPEGQLVPDVAERLPGRGVWVGADRRQLQEAIARGQLARQASRSLKRTIRADAVPADLADRIDALMAQRCLSRLGMELKAGRLVTGFEKVRSGLARGRFGVLIQASDAMPAGRAKLAGSIPAGLPVIDLFCRDQLGLALGRENVVHAAVNSGGAAERLVAEAERLAAYRGLVSIGPQASTAARAGGALGGAARNDKELV